jgi:hypothetical protein
MSSTKRAMIEEGYSEGLLIVANELDKLKEKAKGKPVVVLDTVLQQLIKDKLYNSQHNDRLERVATIRRLARQRGWHINESSYYDFQPWQVREQKSRLICSQKEHARRTWQQLEEAGVRPAF